jgi:hypothetical protein
MSKVIMSLGTVGLALAVGAPVGAQTAEPPPAPAPGVAQAAPAAIRPIDRNELRHQIYVMEGALSRAVEFGAQQLNRELRSVMPDVWMLAGQAQARGVYLEGYGIFFDVEVPMLRQSMIWSLRMMMQPDAASVKSAADQLRTFLQASGVDQSQRASLESALKQLETQATPVTGLGTQVRSTQQGGPGRLMPTEPPMPAPRLDDKKREWLADPNRAYTQAVQLALMDAMLDYSPPRAIGADEWLTVAARDNEQRDSLAPPDPNQEVVTVLLRIKGADLMDYRSGRIDREEARRRVRIGEF